MCYNCRYEKVTSKSIANAVKHQSMVHLIGESADHWGMFSSLSDDGSTMYYLYHGMPTMYSHALITQLEWVIFEWDDACPYHSIKRRS